MKTLTEADVIRLLREEQGEMTAVEFAKEIGISPQYLSDIYAKRRAPGPAILDYLGLQKTYVADSAKQ